MKLLPKSSGCVACQCLILFLVALGSNPVIAADVCDKKPDLPKCNPDPDPPSDPDDPALTVPAFAYYCKSNPNSGAVCLANADGSAPAKIFSTEKFHGDQFNISAVQIGGSGSVLVEDYGVLSRIDYSVTEEGVLDTVYNPETLLEHIGDIDWSPSGDDFAFQSTESIHNIYLGSRADFSSGALGAPIVASPNSLYTEWDYAGLTSVAWSADGNSLYFVKTYLTNDGPWWYELHKAEVGVLLAEGTQPETTCLLATREAPYPDIGYPDYCAVVDPNLTRLYEVSDHDEGLMVSATGREIPGDSVDEIRFVYIPDGGAEWEAIPTPGFRAYDWTTAGTIIGQTDDDEVIDFDPISGDVTVLLPKNATSPDWTN